MRRLLDTSLASLIPLIILLHLRFAPYTKVEESFNMQATHDILESGLPFTQTGKNLRQNFDHMTFTGPVPRTFVGPLALATISWPFSHSVEGVNKQLLVRAFLGLFNAFSLLSFRKGIREAYGRNAANWYSVLQASQFHTMFYASRTLPNFFAFGISTLALGKLLPHATPSPDPTYNTKRYSRALVLLTITGIVFRSELAILLSTHTLYLLLTRRLSLRYIISSGVLGLLIGLSLTIPLDSYLWQRFLLWPELSAFAYNIISNQSVNWGTSPWHYYFTSALPRLFTNPLLLPICVPFTLFLTPLPLDILIPNIAFVAIYSFVPHKEWRFIIYIIPPLLAVASAGAAWIWTRRSKSPTYRLLALFLVASTLASFAASSGMLTISRLNYPGAEALNRLHALESNSGNRSVKVHMDTLTCMTGVTRFLQKEGWVYDKTEDAQMLLRPDFWEAFDYAVVERVERVIGRWEIVGTVEGFAGMRLSGPGEGFGGMGDLERGMLGGVGDGELEATAKVEKGAELEVRSVPMRVGSLVRSYVTRGWWVDIKMVPKLRILKRQGGDSAVVAQ